MDKRRNIQLVDCPGVGADGCPPPAANWGSHPAAPTTAGQHLALLAAGAVCILSFLLALCSFTAHAAAPAQTIAASEQRSFILDEVQAKLGEPVELVDHHGLAALSLPPGKVELALRYAHPAGQWLPSALEARVDGRLVAAVPLGQYLDFKLSVLVARRGLALGAKVDATQLERQTLKLAPGQEVLIDLALADGLQTRGYFAPGMRLKLSRLSPAPLVRRGTTVQLVEGGGGVQLSASGTALADAYAGQALSVRRDSDGRIFRGELKPGDSGAMVVIN